MYFMIHGNMPQRSELRKSSCLHYLLPNKRDSVITDRLHHPKTFKPLLMKTEKFRKSFLANVNSSSCSLFVIGRPSVCRLSVTLVHPTQAIEICGNVSTPCGTLAIHDLCIKILRRSSEGNPFVGGVKHKRGSRI